MARKEETIEDILDRMDDDIMSIRDKIENQDDEGFDDEEETDVEEDDSDPDGW